MNACMYVDVDVYVCVYVYVNVYVYVCIYVRTTAGRKKFLVEKLFTSDNGGVSPVRIYGD